MILYPAATARIVPYPTPGAFFSIGLTLHVQVGDGSPYGWFANPNNGACSHWWVSKTGVVEQYLDAGAKSWAQAAGNATYHSVETEGYPTDPLTPQQINALAGLYRWGHDTFGWPLALANAPGEPGFGTHQMGGVAWGNHPGCPGDLRKAQRQTILNLVQGDDNMPFIYQVTDGPAKNAQLFDYGFGPVHIDGQESKELQAAPNPAVVKPISGATYARRFQGASPKN